MSDRKAYSEGKRRLVMAFDLGTTFSGVSYAVLDPGKVPNIMTVTRYPGQLTSDAKIPTIIHYDKRGKVLAVGAEEPQLPDDDDDEWVEEPLKLEWFKLLLRPASSASSADIPSPKLPFSKTIVDVYADFYAYLFSCARTFIQQTHFAIGNLLWSSVEGEIDFELSHPNGWGGAQQSAMRRAAVQAKLIPDTPQGHSRLTFVSEGEASFHYCLSSESVKGIKAKTTISVIDAGGGTVDISTYMLKTTSPIEVEEVAVPRCLFEGSVIVRQRAETHIRAKLRNSVKFGNESYIQAIAQEFDLTAKKRFKGTGDANVKFSNLLADRDPNFGIRNGTYKLTKEEMCSFFDPAVHAVLDAVRTQRRAMSSGNRQLSTFFLVGGFASSDYLYEKLNKQLSEEGLALCRPDSQTSKAVAEGAVSFYVDRFVTSRVARFTYGVQTSTQYDATKASHLRRKNKVYTNATGRVMLPGFFMSILQKGAQTSETKEFRESLSYTSPRSMRNTTVTVDFLIHEELFARPDFIDDSFHRLFKVTGFLQGVPSTQHRREGGGNYCEQSVDVVISFGLTELKAELAWMKKGVEVRSPAKIIYDDDFAVTVSSS